MKICFCGDVFLGGDLLSRQNGEKIVYSDTFDSADCRIVNLEQPISDNNHVADKCTLYTGSIAGDKLRDMNIKAVNLANNHIQDKGLTGIDDTIEHLTRNGIGKFGAGHNIESARRPYWITEDIALLGYSEFGQPYLRQIQVADSRRPGVNPLEYDSIMKDLDLLEAGKQSILFVHWGIEHVWLPPYKDIALAKKLLEDERVLLIIGTHPHRPQGYIEHNSKRAYMSLGNFLFPNFYIQPPTQIYYPDTPIEHFDITRRYHNVYKTTYKKWRLVNRISILLSFDTAKKSVSQKFGYQLDDYPKIVELFGMTGVLLKSFIWFLSQIYTLPRCLYAPMERISSRLTYIVWTAQIIRFKVKQLGVLESLGGFIRYAKKRANRQK